MPDARTMVVSGASSGIGRAIASLLLEQGHRVIGLGRDFSKCDIRHPEFLPVCIDLAVLDTLPAALDRLDKSHPGIDALICCAGRGRFGSLEEFSCTQLRTLIDLNLTSHICLVRTLMPGMKQRSRGDIILMGSEAALAGGRRGSVYSAAKFGLRGFAQALRQECATSGIRVTIINPGMVKTAFFDELEFRPGDDPGNYILPEDVARAALAVLDTRAGTVIDEINLSPQKKVVRFRKPADN